jgi:phosphate transport system permease protein
MMIAGNNIGGLPTSIFSKIRPLTTNIAMEMGYASGRHQDMLFATGVILFTFIMAINFTLIRITKKLGNEGPLR